MEPERRKPDKDLVTPRALYTVVRLALEKDGKALLQQLKALYPSEDSRKLATSFRELLDSYHIAKRQPSSTNFWNAAVFETTLSDMLGWNLRDCPEPKKPKRKKVKDSTSEGGRDQPADDLPQAQPAPSLISQLSLQIAELGATLRNSSFQKIQPLSIQPRQHPDRGLWRLVEQARARLESRPISAQAQGLLGQSQRLLWRGCEIQLKLSRRRVAVLEGLRV